ncbi:MAG: hypothetical protein WCJ94_05405 [bacterium]
MKKILVVLAVLSLFASMAMASETRIEGLGLNSDFVDGPGIYFGPNSWMISDASNVNLFPATILKYPKLAVFEYNGSDLNSYVNMKLFGGVLGLYTNTNTNIYLLENSVNSGVLYGRNLSDIMSIAVGVTYQQYLDKQVENSTEVPVSNNKDIYVNEFSNAIGINLGLSLLGDIPMDFGLSVAIPLLVNNEDTYFDTAGVKTVLELTKDSGIQAKLRGKATLGDMAVGLGVQLYTDKYEDISQHFTSTGALSYDWYRTNYYQSIMVQLGTVKTIKLDKTTIFAGTQLEMAFTNNYWANGYDKTIQIKTDSTEYYDGLWINVPLIIGAETKINDNWTLRAGARKAMWNNDTYKNFYKNADGKITSSGDTYTQSNTNDLNVNFGATFEVSAFSIDFLVNKDLILSGPEFITGKGAYGDNTTPWASKIALNFKW